MDQPTLDALHGDPKNWRWGMFYVCREDPRIVVPKRIAGLGWTVNFARPAALPFFVALLLLAWGAIRIARELGIGRDGLLVLKMALAAGVIALCHRMAQRK